MVVNRATADMGHVSESLAKVLHQPLLHIWSKEEHTYGSNMKLEGKK